jgi:glycosyltransferase involved in cell wall biosynthesis
MNILFFSHSFYPKVGGIETVSMQLATNFQERQEVSIIVVTRTKESGSLLFPFEIVRDPSVKRIASLLSWCDVVFENNPCYGMSWLNFIFRKPKVAGLHTWISAPDERATLQKSLKKMGLNDYNAVTACSTKIKNFTFDKAIVIGNSYDSTIFRQRTTPKKYEFVFVGRLVSDKGADMCIELLNELNKLKRTEYTLTIIGDGPEMKTLVGLTIVYGLTNQVRFLGFLPAEVIARELNEHKYILVPSRWEEPFGIVVLEGMACGCIPIVSDGGGLPDAVGEAGVVFKRNSLTSLVQSTIQLMDSQEQQSNFIQLAAAHLDRHTEKKVSQQYFDVILKSI